MPTHCASSDAEDHVRQGMANDLTSPKRPGDPLLDDLTREGATATDTSGTRHVARFLRVLHTNESRARTCQFHNRGRDRTGAAPARPPHVLSTKRSSLLAFHGGTRI